MMNPFELTRAMFEDPEAYLKVTPGEKKKNFFIVQRRMAIKFPFQANVLQHVRIDEVAVMDFWQRFLSSQFDKTPHWMYTKGTKKAKENVEKKVNIKEESIKAFASKNGYDIKSVRESIKTFPEQTKREIDAFEKSMS